MRKTRSPFPVHLLLSPGTRSSAPVGHKHLAPPAGPKQRVERSAPGPGAGRAATSRRHTPSGAERCPAPGSGSSPGGALSAARRSHPRCGARSPAERCFPALSRAAGFTYLLINYKWFNYYFATRNYSCGTSFPTRRSARSRRSQPPLGPSPRHPSCTPGIAPRPAAGRRQDGGLRAGVSPSGCGRGAPYLEPGTVRRK